MKVVGLRHVDLGPSAACASDQGQTEGSSIAGWGIFARWQSSIGASLLCNLRMDTGRFFFFFVRRLQGLGIRCLASTNVSHTQLVQ